MKITVGANETERSEKKLQIDMKTEEKSNLCTYNDKFSPLSVNNFLQPPWHELHQALQRP
jgi:hypothetical protein